MSQDAAFLTDFHHAATIGATDNDGVDRQAATDLDGDVRRWFAGWFQDRGRRVLVDEIGNMFGLFEWREGAPFVLVGSHLDTQPLGGRFDGSYGVIAGMHVAAQIDEAITAGDQEAPRYNLAVVNWFNEEGARFAPSVMGSSVFAGLFELEQMLDVQDLEGVSVRKALADIGFLGSDDGPEAVGYAEIHIEQGRILEREGIDLGVVDRSWYTQKLDIEVLGEQSHTGATAMADRRDALVGASEIVLMVRQVTQDFPEEALVSSVGQLVVEPNSPIVVARRVHLVADLRSGDPEIVQQARQTLLDKIEALAARDNLVINVKDFDVRPIRHFPTAGVELAESVVEGLGLTSRRVQTMAGHDSVALNTMVPSAMLFIPSVDGVSHCEREFSTDEDMVKGLAALKGLVQEMLSGKFVDDGR
ncbi:M20 family metallo-hydrolase [Ornithinimicrobium pekingense]|uniref:Zn-dependent hydrolase n=1 Tax=Ornithinimicrobium pekingense TaxID=384677 RepID=A0ABQ2FCA6_9MICO|nr:M20 family metallo-hydrolase [Ornithinimicrobium pekingense]GGK79602.1 Zn-dependent hydrolase [Ornithinimicrobium pekingense]